MASVIKSVDVHVPIRTAYNQWTQFESFPQFMRGVESITQTDPTHTHWVTKVGGVRREFDTMFRNQAERWLRDLDLVKREEFEAVKDMARLAREENEALKTRVAALEAKLGSGGQTSI